MISEPSIKPIAGGYEFTYSDSPVDNASVSIKLRNLGKGRANTLTAEIDIKGSGWDFRPVLGINLNLSKLDDMKKLARDICQQDAEVEKLMYHILFDVRHRAIETYREGEPVQILWTGDDLPPLEYLLEPILIKGVPTIIFGDKGVAKSTLSLVIYLSLLLPWHDNPLGFKVPDRSVKTLLLDYEAPGNIAQLNLKKLQEGLGLPPVDLIHKHCFKPLADEIEQTLNIVKEHSIEVAIVDSLGRAVGGDLSKDTDNINKFFYGLESLKVTPLIIAQTSKDNESKHKTIYGSVFFTYYARSIFEMCRSDMSDVSMNVALFHRWCNLDRRHEPLGYKFTFTNSTTTVESEPVSAALFSDKVSPHLLILEALEEGELGIQELAEKTGLTEGHIRKELSGLKKASRVVNTSRGLWGLAYRE